MGGHAVRPSPGPDANLVDPDPTRPSSAGGLAYTRDGLPQPAAQLLQVRPEAVSAAPSPPTRPRLLHGLEEVRADGWPTRPESAARRSRGRGGRDRVPARILTRRPLPSGPTANRHRPADPRRPGHRPATCERVTSSTGDVVFARCTARPRRRRA